MKHKIEITIDTTQDNPISITESGAGVVYTYSNIGELLSDSLLNGFADFVNYHSVIGNRYEDTTSLCVELNDSKPIISQDIIDTINESAEPEHTVSVESEPTPHAEYASLTETELNDTGCS